MCGWKVSNCLITVGPPSVRVTSCTIDKAILESGGICSLPNSRWEIITCKSRRKMGPRGLYFTRKRSAGSLLPLLASECPWEIRCAWPRSSCWQSSGLGWHADAWSFLLLLLRDHITWINTVHLKLADWKSMKLQKISVNWRYGKQLVPPTGSRCFYSCWAPQCGSCWRPHCSLHFRWYFCSPVHNVLQGYLLPEQMWVIQRSGRTPGEIQTSLWLLNVKTWITK